MNWRLTSTRTLSTASIQFGQGALAVGDRLPGQGIDPASRKQRNIELYAKFELDRCFSG
jgi:hypothetical protein